MLRGVTDAGELCKQGVAGSIPVRSTPQTSRPGRPSLAIFSIVAYDAFIPSRRHRRRAPMGLEGLRHTCRKIGVETAPVPERPTMRYFTTSLRFLVISWTTRIQWETNR